MEMLINLLVQIISGAVGGGVGGLVLTWVVGFIKSKMVAK